MLQTAEGHHENSGKSKRRTSKKSKENQRATEKSSYSFVTSLHSLFTKKLPNIVKSKISNLAILALTSVLCIGPNVCGAMYALFQYTVY